MEKKNQKGIVVVLSIILIAILAGDVWFLSFGNKKTITAKKSFSKPGKKTATDTAKKPDGSNYNETVVSNTRYGFEYQNPDEWTAVVSQNGDGTTYRSPDGKAVILVYGFSNAAYKTLDQLYGENVAARQSEVSGFAEVSRVETVVDGRPAIEGIWTYASSEKTPTKTRFDVVTKGGAGMVLEYTASTDIYDSNEAVFAEIVANFKLQ